MIIVTGGAGFIGSSVIWQLNQKGLTDILIVDNLGSSDKWKNLVNLSFSDYLHKSKLLDLLQLGKLKDINAIVHMGACSSTTEQDADYLMKNNFHYSKALAEYALAKGIRFINASSAATYGDGQDGFSDDPKSLEQLRPRNMYGYSKHLFDLWAKNCKALTRLASLKFFNVFGPNEYHKTDMSSVVYKAFLQVKNEGCIKLFKSYDERYIDGGQMRDFVYVKDCARIVDWLIENTQANGIFNIGSGQARTWNDLAGAVFSAFGLRPRIEYIEMPATIKNSYQYFTQAQGDRLKSLGFNQAYTRLEDAVADYIGGYLQSQDPYL